MELFHVEGDVFIFGRIAQPLSRDTHEKVKKASGPPTAQGPFRSIRRLYSTALCKGKRERLTDTSSSLFKLGSSWLRTATKRKKEKRGE